MDELSFSFLSSACYSLVFSVVWNQEQLHMILLKRQEESPEILSSKTIYCISSANTCQNSACGQNTREYWVLFVLRQSHFSIYLNYKIFLLFLVQSWIWSPKVLLRLKSAAVAASAGEQFGLLHFSVPASELNIAVVWKVCCRVSTVGVRLWVILSHPQFGTMGLATSSAQAAYGDLNFTLLLPWRWRI